VVSSFLKRLPAFSPIAVRLMALVADENVSFKEVAKLISIDPVLSGEVRWPMSLRTKAGG